jgi:hypothetical protein
MKLEEIVRPSVRLIKHGAVKANEEVRFICVNGQSHARAALPTALTGWSAGHCGRSSRIALILSGQTMDEGRGM